MSEEAPPEAFVPTKGVTNEQADEIRKTSGRNELTEKGTPSWLVFLLLVYIS